MLDELTIEHCRSWAKNYNVKYHKNGGEGYVSYRNGAEVCTIYKEVDGYWHAYGFSPGAWEASHLIAVGFLLLELNEPWDEEIRRHFETEQETLDKLPQSSNAKTSDVARESGL